MANSEYLAARLNVLKAIRREGPISRSQLPAITGLSAGTITQLTSGLLKRGVILESKDAAKRSGRPRTYLEIDASAGVVLGAGIEAEGKLTSSFADLRGTQLFSTNTGLDQPGDLEGLAVQIGEVLAGVIEISPFPAADVLRVGLAIPGLVNSARGTVSFMATLAPAVVPFAAIISARLGIPVTVENDQSCMARAEHWFGSARSLDTFTLVHVGHAVTSAEYCEGLPKSGSNGLNPEIGHVKLTVAPDAPQCFCGSRGCLSAYSSILGLLRRAKMIETSPRIPRLPDLDRQFERFLNQAEDGCASTNALLGEAATNLGVAVANHLTATDPGNVLISLSDRRLIERLEPLFRATLEEFTLPGVLPASNVEFVSTSPNWRCLGSAALALEQAYLGLDQDGAVKGMAAGLARR